MVRDIRRGTNATVWPTVAAEKTLAVLRYQARTLRRAKRRPAHTRSCVCPLVFWYAGFLPILLADAREMPAIISSERATKLAVTLDKSTD